MWNSTVKSLVFASLIGLPLLSGATEMEDMSSGTEVVGERVPVKIEGKKSLSLRVLVRPFSNIYADKSVESGIVQSDVPALKPFYVYTRPTAEDRELEAGWYEIGSNTQGKVVGWMQSKDVFEWKQTMCLVYTHPGERKPVLMFDSKSVLNKIIQSEDEERIKKVSKLYAAIDEHNISKDFPVKSVEPKKYVDIKKKFYLLPILDHKAVDFGVREARILKVTAVTNARAGARIGSDIRENTEYLPGALTPSTKVPKELVKKLVVDIVWVMDTTVSMRPYIQDTMDFIRETSLQIAEAQSNYIKINFGIWGYRDSVEEIPKIGYTTKNYTPELIGIKDFTDVLSNVKVTKVDSVDYPEDMFSGISDAMEKTAWSPEGVKLMILVGDAPSHKLGHKWNLSLQNEETLRSLANDSSRSSIYIAALHIKNPKAKKFHELAETQYRTLATNPGTPEGDSAFREILSTDKEAFKIKTNELVGQFKSDILRMEKVLHTDSPADENLSTKPAEGELAFSNESDMMDLDEVIPEIHTPDTNMTGAASRMFRAAMIEWVGSQTGAEAPKDVVAWVIDKDLENPEIPSLKVRLLINKRQLDSLATAIDTIITEGYENQRSTEDFFTSLQAATATIARDPNMVKQANKIADTGMIPEFLEGLPYKSRLMETTKDEWDGWSQLEQNDLLMFLEGKVETYRTLHDTPENWIPLNKGDDTDEYVHPLPLGDLP